MAQQTIKKEQHGSNLKLIISVMRTAKDTSEITTEVMHVGDLAEIRASLRPNSDSLKLYIGMKKRDEAKNFSVKMTLTLDEYVKQISCPYEWMEVLIKQGIRRDCHLCLDSCNVYLYSIVINITAHVVSSLTSYVNNQLYEDEEFTDFQLRTSDPDTVQTVAVHKAVLAIQSGTFKAMLRRSWKETEENSMTLDGATLQTLQALKQFMYLGTLPNEGLEPLLIIANRFMMENLEEECISKVITSLKPENFDGLIEFACQNNLPRLMRALVLRIPRDVVNGVNTLKATEKKSEDTEQ